MTDYTPTTDWVRLSYALHESLAPVRRGDSDMGEKLGPFMEDFDRWLEEHDRQVAEEAYDEGFANGVYYHEDTIYAPLNPYRYRKAES